MKDIQNNVTYHCHYAECYYTGRHVFYCHAECHYDKYCSAECRILIVMSAECRGTSESLS
jgi:hypothetical protein